MNADKKITIFLCFCLAFWLFLGWNAFAESKTIVLGGKTGWPELSSSEGVTFGTGRFGYEAVELSTNARAITSDTDLLLDFESFDDKSGHFAAQSNSLLRSPKAVMGHYSALSRGNGKGLYPAAPGRRYRRREGSGDALRPEAERPWTSLPLCESSVAASRNQRNGSREDPRLHS